MDYILLHTQLSMIQLLFITKIVQEDIYIFLLILLNFINKYIISILQLFNYIMRS